LATSTHVCPIINYFENSILKNDIFPNIPSDFLFPSKIYIFEKKNLMKISTFLKII